MPIIKLLAIVHKNLFFLCFLSLFITFVSVYVFSVLTALVSFPFHFPTGYNLQSSIHLLTIKHSIWIVHLSHMCKNFSVYIALRKISYMLPKPAWLIFNIFDVFNVDTFTFTFPILFYAFWNFHYEWKKQRYNISYFKNFVKKY